MFYQYVIARSVTILFKKSSCIIEDNTSKVSDAKCRDGVRLGLDVVLVAPVLLVESLGQRDVCGLGELGLLVNQGDDVHGLLGDHVKCGLIVNEGNLLPVDTLFAVLLLFHLKDVFHKELLKVFVGIVDAHLFKTIVLKILKTKDIQNTYGTLVTTYFFLEYRSIYFLEDSTKSTSKKKVILIFYLDNMNKQSAIYSFSKGVPDIPGLIAGDCGCHCVSVNPDGLACQSS